MALSAYTVIVDDSNSLISYGPDDDSWSPFNSDHAYQGTFHNAISQDANMTFSFVGGREVIVRGDFYGENNASNSAMYPAFRLNSGANLNCIPTVPQNGGQFICSASLSSTITNHTLSMFVDSNIAIQQFHIDYIRHGTNAQTAQAGIETVVFVQSPDRNTPGLSFDDSWQNIHSLGDGSDVENAIQTLTPSSTATYHFSGDSFAWWGCCMPPDTSSNAASGAYSIDGGSSTAFQIDEQFIQGPQCRDEKILFQTQNGQLQSGNHTIEVTYSGDSTKMPLTLCALAAVPLDFAILDFTSTNANLPAVTSSPHPSSTSHTSQSPDSSGRTGTRQDQKNSPVGMIVGIVCGGWIVFIVLGVCIIWWRRKRAKRRAQENRSSSTDSLLPLSFHYPLFGFIDTDKRRSAVIGSRPASLMAPPINNDHDRNNELRRTDTSSHFSMIELRPPSYHTTGSLHSL